MKRITPLILCAFLAAVPRGARADRNDCVRAINAISLDLAPARAVELGDRAVELCDGYGGEDKAKARQNRATGYIGLERWAEALADLDAAIPLMPAEGVLYSMRGAAHGKLGHYEEAIRDFDKAIEYGTAKPHMDYNARGINLQKAGRYDQALKDMTRAIELNPGDAGYRESRGRLYYEKLKDLDKALADFNEALSRDASLFMSYMERGGVYLQRGDYAKSVADLERAAALKPSEANFWSVLGTAAYLGGKYDKCADAHGKAIALGGAKPSEPFDRAKCLYFAGRYDAAIAELEKVREREPKTDGLGYYLGDAYRRTKAYPKALEAIDKAIPDWPKSSDLHLARGRVLQDQGDDAGALKELDIAAALEPRSTQVFQAQALSYDKLKKKDKVVEAYTRVLAIEPGNVDVLRSRALQLGRMKRLDEALADGNRLVELDPKDPQNFLIRGLIFAHMDKKKEQAVADFTKAVELDPASGLYRRLRGSVGFDLGRLDEALADYRKAYELGERKANVFVGIGRCLAAKGDSEKALAEYVKALAADAKSSEALAQRGLLYFDLGRLADAAKDFAKILEDDADDEDGHFGRAIVLLRQGKRAEAAAAYGKAAEAEPRLASDPEALSREDWRLSAKQLAAAKELAAALPRKKAEKKP